MLKVGLIGTGVIFDLNVLGYLNREDVEITCLCNRTIDKAKQKIEKFNLNKNIPIYSDYKEMKFFYLITYMPKQPCMPLSLE